MNKITTILLVVGIFLVLSLVSGLSWIEKKIDKFREKRMYKKMLKEVQDPQGEFI